MVEERRTTEKISRESTRETTTGRWPGRPEEAAAAALEEEGLKVAVVERAARPKVGVKLKAPWRESPARGRPPPRGGATLRFAGGAPQAG